MTDTTPWWVPLLGLIITNLGALAIAWLQMRAKAKAEAGKAEEAEKAQTQAALAEVVIKGVENATQKIGKVEASQIVKDAIKEVATSRGIQDVLHAQVKRFTQ